MSGLPRGAPEDGPIECPRCGSKEFLFWPTAMPVQGTLSCVSSMPVLGTPLETPELATVLCVECNALLYSNRGPGNLADRPQWMLGNYSKAVPKSIEQSKDFLDLLKKLQSNPNLVNKIKEELK